MQFYRKCIGELTCVGLDALTQTGQEKGVRLCKQRQRGRTVWAMWLFGFCPWGVAELGPYGSCPTLPISQCVLFVFTKIEGTIDNFSNEQISLIIIWYLKEIYSPKPWYKWFYASG